MDSLKRGTKVKYQGNEKFHPLDETYIWSVNMHLMTLYIIQHPNGYPKEKFLSKIRDGFEAPYSNELKDGLLYIYAEENLITCIS